MEEYGLALAGGGTRGAAHVGVLKALAQEDLLPSTVAGTSAGSIVAGLFAAGMSVDEMEETVLEMGKFGIYLVDPDYLGILTFIPETLMRKKAGLTGLIKGKILTGYLCDLTGGITIRQAGTRLVIPAVDLCSGETIAFTNFESPSEREHVIWEHDGRLCDIMMASSSVPGVFRPKRLGKYCLVDGGVTNNLPVDLLIASGESNVIAVDLGVDYDMPHEDTITEVVSHSFTIMSTGLKDCMSSGEMLLLKPDLPAGAGLLTFGQMRACMEAGYRYTKKMMPEIKSALRKPRYYGIKMAK